MFPRAGEVVGRLGGCFGGYSSLLYLLCTLSLLLLHQLNLRSTGIRSWSLGTPVLTLFIPTMAPWVKRLRTSFTGEEMEVQSLQCKRLSQESKTASWLRARAPVCTRGYLPLHALCALMHHSCTVAGHSAISLHWRAREKQLQDITTGFPQEKKKSP